MCGWVCVTHLQAAAEVVDARVCVNVVVNRVGVALTLSLVGGGNGSGSLDWGHWLPNSDISPIAKGLDSITYRGKMRDKTSWIFTSTS